MQQILFCPLDLPKIEPLDWDEWWHTWKSAKLMPKMYKNHNTTPSNWLGLDLYVRPNFQLEYIAPLAEQNKTVKNLCNQVFDLMKFSVNRIRIIENLEEIPSHTDTKNLNSSIRSFLWNNYTEPVWKFRSNNDAKDLIMPNDTNSFYYLDGAIKHESIYKKGFSKGILAVYGTPLPSFQKLLENSSEKYLNYSWIAENIV